MLWLLKCALVRNFIFSDFTFYTLIFFAIFPMLTSKFDQFFNFTSYFAKDKKVSQIFSFLSTLSFSRSLRKLKKKHLSCTSKSNEDTVGIVLVREHAKEGEVLAWLTCYCELSTKFLVVKVLFNNSRRKKLEMRAKLLNNISSVFTKPVNENPSIS